MIFTLAHLKQLFTVSHESTHSGSHVWEELSIIRYLKYKRRTINLSLEPEPEPED
ncbi:unnamed protein product [Amoebophrya sp. A25]|nr:unnamed protein product [Amoebophrya sp. A25]|eukprot:GSA25T00010445001.1